MKSNKKSVDDFFKEKLGRYKETPPADVWDELDTRLDTLVPQAPTAPYRWMKHVAIVSLIVFLGASVVKKMLNPTDNANTALNETATVNTDHTQEGTLVKNNDQSAAATGKTDESGTTNTATANAPIAEAAVQHADNHRTKSSRHQTIITKHNVAGSDETVANAGRANIPEHVYEAFTPKTGDQELTYDNGKGGPMANTDLQPNKDAKKNDGNTAAETQGSQATAHRNFSRIEAGVKIGYEGGLNDRAAMKYVVSPYLQYNITSKLAIMTQPAVKYATINTKNISNETYYNEHSDSSVKGKTTPIIIGGTTEFQSTYTYSQTHDSIVKSYSFRGSYMELELPLLVKYSICEKLSVYGGVNVNYSKLTGITENTYTASSIQRSVNVTSVNQDAPAAASPVSSVLTYGGKPITEYNGNPYAAPTGSMVRVGYMVGFSYAYSKKWLVDALMQQTPTASDVQGGYNVNSPLSSTYFRLSVGYKFTK